MRRSIVSRREFLSRTATAAAMLGVPAWIRGADRSSRFDDVSRFIEEQIAAGVVPGAALIVSRQASGGPRLFEKSWGTFCNRQTKTAPLTPDVVHTFFSYSKLVGSTVIATVVQDGLLDLDKPVSAWIPEFANGGKEKVTIRHLLTHAAGVPNVTVGSVETPEKWKEAIATVCAAKAEWEPGSKSLYHGLTGQLVAGEAALRVTKKKSWNELCRERLFTPLGAKTLTYGVPESETKFALTPQPDSLPAAQGKMGNILLGQPSGGCHGTIRDALRVLELHLNGGTWNGKTILKPALFREMHTVQWQKEIDQARQAGKPPAFQCWGLGPLLRGTGPSDGSHAWFGFRDQKHPGVFGHAGIDTVIGVADPETGVALFFVTSDSPKSNEKTTALRNGVTNRVMSAFV